MQNVCLQELLALWLEACAAKGASAKTIKTYHTQTEPFVRFLLQQGCQTPEDVTPQHVRRYLLFWRERGVSSETLWNYYRNPRTFLNWCIREGLTESNPFARVDPPKRVRTVKRALDPDQFDQLLRVCSGTHWTDLRNRALLLVLVSTGLRIHEALRLTVGHASQQTVVITGKGGKQRVVILHPDVRLALTRYLRALQRERKIQLDASSPLWWSRRGGAMTLDGLKITVRKLGAKAGLKAGAHALRRTAGTWCIANGMNPVHVQMLLGHSDLKTTMRYLCMTEQDLLRAYEAHNPLKLLKK